MSACGSSDDSRNAALLPGNFEISVDKPYQLESGPSLRDENVAGDLVAQSFTSNSRATKLTSVTLQVSRDSQGDGTARKIVVRLHSSVGGYPGERIADLGSVPVSDGFTGAKTIAVVSPPALSTSRDYFVVVASGGGSGTVSARSAVNTPLSNVETKPTFRMVKSTTGQVGEWTDSDVGRNLVMSLVVEDVLVAAPTTARATSTSAAVATTSPPTTQAAAGRSDATSTTVAVTSTTMRSSMTTAATATLETTTTVSSAGAGQSATSPTTTRAMSATAGQIAGASVTTTTAMIVVGADATVPDTTPPSPSDSSVVDTGDTAVTPISDSTIPGTAPDTGPNPGEGSESAAGGTYSPVDDPETTRDIAATLAAFAALMAAGAAGAFTGSGGGAGASRARLSTLATKKLKATGTSRAGAGDAGRLWRRPGTDRVDRLFARLPERIGPYSAVGSRVLVDGSWARAIVGSFSLTLWPVAAAVGCVWGLDVGDVLGLPEGWLFAVALVLGVIDSLVGGIVALALTVTVLASGGIDDWSDVRTTLGIWVILLSPPLIGNVIRPLRRVVHDVDVGLRERVFDYVMAPVGVAFAIEAMTKALNGLSGTIIVNSGDLTLVKITVWCAMVARLVAEDAAVHFFPERSRAVQPARIPGQTKAWGVASAAVRFAVYLFVSEPFFGMRASTVVAGLLLVVPFAMKPWEDELPNKESLWRWLPRGFLRFATLVLFGGWLAAVLLGDSPTADTVRAMTPWLFVPSAFFGIAEYFGRAGEPWPDSRVKRWGGAVLWVVVVLVLAGAVEPF